MTKSNRTLRALIGSILSMIVCFAMLVGSTFAWFSDSVVSGTNKIVAGNLDVELQYSILNEDGSFKEWKDVKSDTSVFKDGAKWEPGHTEYVYLKIKNAGSLALKYKLSLNVYADASGAAEKSYTSMLTNEDGTNKKFKLSEHLVFTQEDGQKTITKRENLWIKNAEEEKAALGKLDGLGKTNQKLLSGDEEIITVAVYMPTSVGNEANQLTSAKATEGEPTIFLGLDLQATQTPYENDSFDENYDKEAPADTFKVSSTDVNSYLSGEKGSLSNARLLLSSGEYNLEIGKPSKYENTGTVYKCIDGTNHSKQELTFTNADEYKAHMNDGSWHAVPRYTTTIENLTIVGEPGVKVNGFTISSGHIYESPDNPVLDNNQQYYFTHKIKNLRFENVEFVGKIDINTSNEDTEIEDVTFENCTFNIDDTSADHQGLRYYNESNNGQVKNLVVKDCQFNNCYQGIYTSNINGITVTGCTFDTTAHNAIAIQSNGGSVNHKAVRIENNIFKNIGDRIIRFGDVGADTQLTIKNNTAENSGDSDNEIMKASSLEEGITYDIANNNWGEGKVVVNPELADKN